MLTLGSTLALASGGAIPRLGFGTYQIKPGPDTRRAVEAALAAGYRHLDTARIYGNEADVGAALAASGIPRGEVFVTTKLWNDDQGYDSALAACRRSLERLRLDFLDLYLLHWPVPELRNDSWRALERLRADGLCKAIGVSNFTERHLDELLASSSVVPEVNQIELSPFLTQDALRAYCRGKGIVVEAYSPLTRGKRLKHPVLTALAARLGKTPAQVLIRWCLDRELVVLPKSVRPERIRENAAVFDFALSAADLATLDGLDEALHTSWDPTHAP